MTWHHVDISCKKKQTQKNKNESVTAACLIRHAVLVTPKTYPWTDIKKSKICPPLTGVPFSYVFGERCMFLSQRSPVASQAV